MSGGGGFGLRPLEERKEVSTAHGAVVWRREIRGHVEERSAAAVGAGGGLRVGRETFHARILV